MSDRIKFEMEFPIKVSQKLLFQFKGYEFRKSTKA